MSKTASGREIVLATRNPKKLLEMKRILEVTPFAIRDATEFPQVPDAVEDGQTFRDNATRKALHYAMGTGLLAVADDSGLEVDALHGRPGPLSARFAGAGAGDADNLDRLLEELRGVPDRQRAARYRCVMVLAAPDGQVLATTEGVCEGRLLSKKGPGNEGFGYDPVFLVADLGKTFAEVPASEKDRRSHRGIAARALLPILDSLWTSVS